MFVVVCCVFVVVCLWLCFLFVCCCGFVLRSGLLRSVRAHCDLALAVEVRDCPLRSGEMEPDSANPLEIRRWLVDACKTCGSQVQKSTRWDWVAATGGS